MRPRAWGALMTALWLFLGFHLANGSLSGLLPLVRPSGQDASFNLFETGQVRPLALSPDGEMLFVVNTPDDRLEIFATGDFDLENPRGSLSPVVSVPVGLEPVAVAVRSQNEVWVVNHLSDSVSIVDISDLSAARVVRTLLVGDEPRDIVFGGPSHDRAFITTAHRGQNSPVDPQLTAPGIGRADVWVFDANNLGETLEGSPLTIITLFCDTPRALAVTPDGKTVYAAAFLSGNRTTTIPVGSIPTDGLPPPRTNFQGIAAPKAGLIVKFRPSPQDARMHWLDELDRDWDETVRFSLPDRDVFAIDAAANPPVQKSGALAYYTGVGTVLFNMVVNPANGQIYVSNTDAQNDQRFAGPGLFAGHSVRGHLVESRITVLNEGQVLPRHLNKHIDYSRCCDPSPNAESVKSLAFPTDMAISRDGSTLYVAAFGSSKVGVFDTAELESDTFVPDTTNQIIVSGGGPSGLALNDAGNRLYVLTRFDDAISVVDLTTRSEIAHVAMFNPEPPSVTGGRRFLYDASTTSSHGDSACASCHVFGDFDGLAWDLGNPDGTQLDNPGPFVVPPSGQPQPFHPMKGPMTTQSLRGMDNHGPMHWRGDRTGGNDAPSLQPDSGSFDEDAAFKKFNVAFPDLLGRSAQLTPEEMQAFTDFVLQITYPPNPIRNLDNSLTPEQQAGRDFYFGITTGGLPSDQFQTCQGCHVLDPEGNREFGVARPGFFGTDGRSSVENEPQLFKIPHLRNLYQKVGMFGMSPDPFFPVDPNPFMGDQVRGFGFLHDGSVDTLFRFHGAGVFVQRFPQNPGGIPLGPAGEELRRRIEAFLLAFNSNLAPIVGQQVTLTQTNIAAVSPRIDLLEARATLNECDLLVHGRVRGRAAAFLYIGREGTFARSQSIDPPIRDAELRALAKKPDGELTFTCFPPGSGARIARVH
jgi:DNA-binding beta-propeller fold protein YncE